MATLTKYQVFVEDLLEGVHDFDNHVFKVLLSNTAPVVATHQLRSQTTELATAGGYVSGGVTVAITTSRTGAVAKAVSADALFTATGALGPFRYAILYNDTPTSPLDPLIGYWDYGASVTLAAGETFTVDCDPTNGILTIT